jgi:hypothetical protein
VWAAKAIAGAGLAGPRRCGSGKSGVGCHPLLPFLVPLPCIAHRFLLCRIPLTQRQSGKALQLGRRTTRWHMTALCFAQTQGSEAGRSVCLTHDVPVTAVECSWVCRGGDGRVPVRVLCGFCALDWGASNPAAAAQRAQGRASRHQPPRKTKQNQAPRGRRNRIRWSLLLSSPLLSPPRIASPLLASLQGDRPSLCPLPIHQRTGQHPQPADKQPWEINNACSHALLTTRSSPKLTVDEIPCCCPFQLPLRDCFSAVPSSP